MPPEPGTLDAANLLALIGAGVVTTVLSVAVVALMGSVAAQVSRAGKLADAVAVTAVGAVVLALVCIYAGMFGSLKLWP